MKERPPFMMMTFLFVSLGILVAFFAINVEAQQQQQQQQQQQEGQQGNVSQQQPTQSHLPRMEPHSPPLSEPRSQPSLPAQPLQPMVKPPSPALPTPLPPLSPSPRVPLLPSPLPIPTPPANSPPSQHPPTKAPNEVSPNSKLNEHWAQKKMQGSRLNPGQKIGLLFIGIVVILQIGVVGFLVFKRKQLLRMHE